MIINYLRKKDCISEKTEKTIKISLLPLGVLLAASGKTIGRFFPESEIASFISGMLMGLSVVALIAGIVVNRHYLKK